MQWLFADSIGYPWLKLSETGLNSRRLRANKRIGRGRGKPD